MQQPRLDHNKAEARAVTQQKATWAQSNHFNVDYDQWANTAEDFSYIMTTSNLHLLVFDTSRKST